MKMNGADAILRSLEAEGVDVVFGLPGGAVLPTYDAFARGTTVRHVLARHEQGAGHMAEGYARATGRVGVALATSGPGATNLVTPIADAWMDSTPLVCITGQVRSHLIGTDAFQECDITGITIPIVKHSWLVQDVEDLPHALKAAFHVARTGRCGPVLVDVPRDVQEAEFDFEYPESVDLPGWKPPRVGHPRQIRRAAEALAAAERPVLYVGGGVLNADACDELRELAEAGELPVITTLMGKSAFPETHELHFGWPGMHGPKWSNWAMNKCDLLVAVGARFDDRVTGKLSAFAPGATVVHLDIDSAEISKLRQADLPVVGPLKQVLADLGEELRAIRSAGPVSRAKPWLRQLSAWREEFPLRYRGSEDVLKPQLVLETLQALTVDRDVVWTTGVGQHQMWAMQYLLCDRPRSFITSGGLGTMGYGVPAAIGAKAARPEATVVCVDGDGCFQMTGQELATSVLEGLPIVVVIVNNGYLGMVRQWQDMFFDERFSQVHLTHQVPDYARLAEAYGAAGFTVDRPEELEEVLEEALTCGRTAVVDARVDAREHCFPMIPAGAAALDLVEFPDEVEEEEAVAAAREAYLVGPGREQAGCADAHLEHVRAARLQHREPRGRPDRAARRVENHPARRLRAAPARADREADAQARERPPCQRARARRSRRARARADEGRSLAGATRRADRARAGVQRARRRSRTDSIVFEVVGHPEEIDSFEELVRPHGLRELVRTGRIGVGRTTAPTKRNRRQHVLT